MGEQGGLRTGWIAAFGTEGYEGEPPLLEELGVNFGHIKGKVRGLEACSTCIVWSKNRERNGLSCNLLFQNVAKQQEMPMG